MKVCTTFVKMESSYMFLSSRVFKAELVRFNESFQSVTRFKFLRFISKTKFICYHEAHLNIE